MKVNGQLHGLSTLPLPHWLEGRVILLVHIDALVEVSDSWICQESNHGSSVVHPVAHWMCQLGTWSGVGTFTENYILLQNYILLKNYYCKIIIAKLCIIEKLLLHNLILLQNYILSQNYVLLQNYYRKIMFYCKIIIAKLCNFGLSCPVNIMPCTSFPPDRLEKIN
jgi:hypothetical protein